MSNLLEELDSVKKSLPSQQRKLCEHILANCKSVSLMNVGDLSEESGVGRATVIRFIKNLGFENYADFKRALHESYFGELERHNSSVPFFWSDEDSVVLDHGDSISMCCFESIQNLQQTEKSIDRVQFNKIVDLIISARRVNVAGFRTSQAISHYTYHVLSYLLNNVRDLSDSESLSYDWILNMSKDEVMLMFSSAPVTTASINLLNLCKEKQIPLILISDSDRIEKQIAPTYSLIVPRSGKSKFTILPFMMIIEALINEIGNRLAPVSIMRMNDINQYLDENKIVFQ